jgi:hypothetical protein
MLFQDIFHTRSEHFDWFFQQLPYRIGLAFDTTSMFRCVIRDAHACFNHGRALNPFYPITIQAAGFEFSGFKQFFGERV